MDTQSSFSHLSDADLVRGTRCSDFAQAVISAVRNRAISDDVAANAMLEVLLRPDPTRAAHTWTILLENSEFNDLESMTVLGPDGEVRDFHFFAADQAIPKKLPAPKRTRKAKGA